jgi:hypothetical protein
VILLFVLIPVVLLLALLGLGMCRLAALSDHSYAVAVAEWVAAGGLTEQDSTSDEHHAARVPFDPRGASFRAAG